MPNDHPTHPIAAIERQMAEEQLRGRRLRPPVDPPHLMTLTSLGSDAELRAQETIEALRRVMARRQDSPPSFVPPPVPPAENPSPWPDLLALDDILPAGGFRRGELNVITSRPLNPGPSTFRLMAGRRTEVYGGSTAYLDLEMEHDHLMKTWGTALGFQPRPLTDVPREPALTAYDHILDD